MSCHQIRLQHIFRLKKILNDVTIVNRSRVPRTHLVYSYHREKSSRNSLKFVVSLQNCKKKRLNNSLIAFFFEKIVDNGTISLTYLLNFKFSVKSQKPDIVKPAAFFEIKISKILTAFHWNMMIYIYQEVNTI